MQKGAEGAEGRRGDPRIGKQAETEASRARKSQSPVSFIREVGKGVATSKPIPAWAPSPPPETRSVLPIPFSPLPPLIRNDTHRRHSLQPGSLMGSIKGSSEGVRGAATAKFTLHRGESVGK